jgi:hypothetical protein
MTRDHVNSSAPGSDRGAKGSMPNPGVEGEEAAGTISARHRPVPAPQPEASAGAPEGEPIDSSR